MLVSRIWDAVSDPLMGIVADRTSTRWGRYRPYLLWMAVPFAVAFISLLFMVLYPLNKRKMEHIQNYLIIHRKNNQS